jgi:mono/diheme cytochrome c family protein
MRAIKTLLFLIILSAAALVAYAYSGLYNVAVGTGHNAVTAWYLSTLRERSIEVRTEGLNVPGNLDSEERILAGASHYREVCVGCHGHPGREPNDNLEPVPPALYQHAEEPAEAFWVVKHGIKLSAMPRQRDHSDEEIWDIVAFLQRLPELDADDYEAITAEAGDHHHGDAGDSESPPARELPAGPVAAVDAFHQALKDGDSAAALALLHDKATILEDGQIETRQEYAGHHLGADMKFAAQTQSETVSREQQVNDRQATVTTRSRVTGSHDGSPVDVVLDEAATLYRTDDGWLITHIQWSQSAGENDESAEQSGDTSDAGA